VVMTKFAENRDFVRILTKVSLLPMNTTDYMPEDPSRVIV